MMTNGILAIKIKRVGVSPNWGCPEVNSNTEPTEAMAAIQQLARNKPLLGVIIIVNL